MKDLPRTFIYRDRSLDEILKDHPLNDSLYDIFLDVKDSYYNLKISAEKIFNEVYYQCTRLLLDPHPEERVWDYRNEAKETTGWRYTSDLVFSIVYAILSLQPVKSPAIERFLRVLKGAGLNDCYFSEFQKFFDSQSRCPFPSLPWSFIPCPESPGRINEYGVFLWSEVTNDYDQERIRFIVDLWKTKDDKLSILSKIENAYKYDREYNNPDLFPLPF